VRAGRGPRFLEFRTYRFRAHSMFDAELYRSKAEVEQWKLRCPITTFVERLTAEAVLDEAALAAIEAEIAAEIASAVAFAEAARWEPVEELTRDVYTGRAA
jgi:pyruvate dehydrogenase E1 component alpha subunit